MDHPGAGDAHVDDPLPLANAVEGSGHEGVVVAEHHQLGAAEAAPAGGPFSQLLDGLAHEGHRVHVDPRFGGAHVDGGADDVRLRQGLGDGGDEPSVRLGHALLHQSGEAADEIHSAFLRRPVQGFGEGDVVLRLRGGGHQGNGGDGNALVDDGDAKFLFDLLAGSHQLFRAAGDLVVDPRAGFLRVAVGAGEEGDTHGDGPHVQMLLVDHLDGLHDLVMTEHTAPP